MDTSQQHAIEGQIRQARTLDAVGRLAGGLAHDFNNLLTSILGYANLLARTFETDDARLKDVDEIVMAAKRASELTRQLLAVSRRQVLELGSVDLNQAVENTVPILRRLIADNVEIVTSLAPDVAPVTAEVVQLQQVIVNLAVNARDAMPNGGRIVIETANAELDRTYAAEHLGVIEGHCVRLTVSDNGTGMTEEVKERLFEPYFTTKPMGQGVGLGLATVRGTVHQFGGHIWVYSEPNRGSTFKIYLPRAEGLFAETAPPVARPKMTGSERVLVVEDERAVRYLVRTILGRGGYELFEAGSPEEARTWLADADRRLDLLITDVIMPGGNGPDLFDTARLARPSLKVLYMSGYTDDAVSRERLLQPDAAFIQKPFTAEDLSRKVREVLDR
jgi:nitrogen-specific signal transduction histidine kinase